ncbi:MAG: DUF2510 domain-containing protein [Propionibacteriaceae bacterium]|nr:DUF2510 domain-containing protein [Propionibacteriaceae bacterium]
MSAPGWYRDPRHPQQLRYWDGSQWTTHARPMPSPTAAKPSQQPPTAHTPTTSKTRRGRPLLWGIAALALTLLLGVGWYLRFGPGNDQSAKPTAPTTSASSEEPTPTSPAPTSNSPTPQDSPVSPTSLQVGDTVEPLAGCPTATSGGRGQLDGSQRLAVDQGFSMPAVEGMEPALVDFGFIHNSNSMRKLYPDNGWMSSISIGVLDAADGFTDLESSATRAVGCLVGNGIAYPDRPQATVTQVDAGSEATRQLWVEVPITGQTGITHDNVHVLVTEADGQLNVFLSAIPNSDSGMVAAVETALQELVLQ